MKVSTAVPDASVLTERELAERGISWTLNVSASCSHSSTFTKKKKKKEKRRKEQMELSNVKLQSVTPIIFEQRRKIEVTNLHRFEGILFSLLPLVLLSNEQVNR